jgi:hypothetical protein
MSTDVDPTVYRQAADVLRHDSWGQGRLHGSDGTHCLVGALCVVTGKNGNLLAKVEPELTPLADLLGGNPACGGELAEIVIINWNDADGRTADEVVTLLEQAAEKLEADR